MIAKTFAPFSGVKPFAIMESTGFGTGTPPGWRTTTRWRTEGTTSTASTAALSVLEGTPALFDGDAFG